MGTTVRSVVGVAAAVLVLPAAATAAVGVDGDPSPRAPHERPVVRPSGAAGFVPGELLVRFRSSAGARERADARADVDARLLTRLPVPGLENIHVGPDVMATARALERRPDVLYAEPNYRVGVAATPDDPRFGQLWGLHNTGQTVAGRAGTVDEDIDAPEAWDRSTGGPGVTVAVVDSGVAADHPDLAANIWANSGEVAGNRVDDDQNGYVDDVHGWDWVDRDADPHDLNGHGTHVAGTIGASGGNGVGVTGVAWDVSLLPLRVLAADGYGSYSDVVRAFAYAGSKGVDVVNASLGGSGSSQAMQDVIAQHPRTLFVTAAGNAGSDNDVTPDYPCSYTADNVVCVAATNNRKGLAGFSNYGAASVDLAAPGVSTLSTVPPEEVARSESFEDVGWSGRWTSDGTPSWGLETDPYGDFTSDSPGTQYAPDTNTWLRTTTPLDLRGGRHCTVDYWLQLDVQPDVDFLRLEASSDGTTWQHLSSWSDSFDGWLPARDDLRPFDGQSSVYLRFRLSSDGSVQGDGAKIDDVVVACQYAYDGDEYASYDGTSMASPHVAGAAALLYAADTTATSDEVRAALLAGVDPLPSLAGKTVTGGRLNVRSALDVLVGASTDTPEPSDTTAPDTTIRSAPAAGTARTATFDFTASEPGSTFACSLDGQPFATCQPPVDYADLTPGVHHFEVRARDAAGNADASPAGHSWTVENTAPTGVRAGGFATPFTTTTDVRVLPDARDVDGIDHYDLRYRAARYDGAFSNWSTVDTGLPAGWGVRVGVPPGQTVCFSARASDPHGATSAWGTRRCTAVPLDDRGLTRSTGWASRSGSRAFRGTLTVSSRRGAAMQVRGAGVRRVALLATTSPGSGTVDVYRGRTLLKRVSLTAATTRDRQVIPVRSWATGRSGGFRVVVRTSGKPVRVDGLALGR